MASRTHLMLRLGALALLVALGAWPRTPSAHASRTAEPDRAHHLVRTTAPHALAGVAGAARQRLVPAAPVPVDVVADVDDSALTN